MSEASKVPTRKILDEFRNFASPLRGIFALEELLSELVDLEDTIAARKEELEGLNVELEKLKAEEAKVSAIVKRNKTVAAEVIDGEKRLADIRATFGRLKEGIS